MGPSCQSSPYGIAYGIAFLYLEQVELSLEWGSYPYYYSGVFGVLSVEQLESHTGLSEFDVAG